MMGVFNHKFLVLVLYVSWFIGMCSSLTATGKDGDACDIGFVLDTSGSIRKPDYIKEKHFVSRFAKFLGFDHERYGIVQFSHRAKMEIKFTDFSNSEEFDEAVNKLKQAGSITRIDRGLLLAQNTLFTKTGGHENDRNRVLFLLTDGTQTPSLDMVENALIASNIRFSGTEFFVLGVGKGVKKGELEKIAGGKERVFYAKSFDELQSDDFIKQFNVTCGSSDFKYSSSYYVWLTFINKSPEDVTISIVQDSGEETRIQVPASSEKEYKRQRLLQRQPHLFVKAVQNGIDVPLLSGKQGSLRFQYESVERIQTVTFTKSGISQSIGYQVLFFFSNRLSYKVTLKITINGKERSYSVFPKRMYYVDLLNIRYPGKITFTAFDGDGNMLEMNNLKQVNVNVGGKKYLYRVFMQTGDHLLSNNLNQYTYSVTFQIYNIGRSKLIFKYQSQEFQVDSDKDETKTIKLVGNRQPSDIRLQVKLPNKNTWYFVKDLIPVRYGSTVAIVIGDDFHYYIPRSFQFRFKNLIEDYKSTVSISVAGSKIPFEFQRTDRQRVVHVYLVYAQPHPAFTINGFYMKGKTQKTTYINGKPKELVGSTGKYLSLDSVIYLSRYPTARKRFWAHFKNNVNTKVALKWTIDETVTRTIPENDLVFAPRVKEYVLLQFWNYQNLKSTFLTAYDVKTKNPMFIDGKNRVEVLLHQRRPKKVDTHVITKPGYTYYTAFSIDNKLKNTITLYWYLQSSDESPLSSNSQKSFNIGPESSRKISVEFISRKGVTKEEMDQIKCLISATKANNRRTILLNGESQHLLSVAAKDLVQNTFIATEKSYKYSIKIQVTNSYGRDILLMFRASIQTDIFVNYDPINVEINADEKDKEITYSLESKKELTRDEAKGIISILAYDPETTPAPMINGKPSLAFDGDSRNVDELNPVKCYIQKPLEYYALFSITNNLRNIVNFNWKLHNPNEYPLKSNDPTSFSIEPTTDVKKISISWKTWKNLTVDEWKQVEVHLTATDHKNKAVLLNGKPIIVVMLTGKGGKETKITTPNNDLKYLLNFEIVNSLSFPVTISFNKLTKHSQIRQEPDKNSYVIEPTSNKMIIMKFITPNEQQFKERIVQFLKLTASSRQGEILLDGQKELTFDLSKDELVNKIKITLAQGDRKRIDKQGFRYYTRINGINSYGGSFIFMFQPAIYDRLVVSSPANVTVGRFEKNKDIIYAVESKRELTSDETKGLIQVSAYDPMLRQRILVNGKKHVALDGISGNPIKLKVIDCEAQKPKHFKGQLRFSVLSDAENQVIVFKWKTDYGIQIINELTQLELVYKEHLTYTVHFTYTLANTIFEEDLFQLTARNKATDKMLLVNGKPSFETGASFIDERVHLVVTDIKGKEYSSRVAVTNTLGEPVELHWKCNNLLVPSLYLVNTEVYALNPGQAKTITISANSLQDLQDSELISSVVLHSYNTQIGGDRQRLLVNNQISYSVNLYKNVAASKEVGITITKTEEYKYYFTFIGTNYFSRPVTLSWYYHDNKLKRLSSPSQVNLNIEGSQKRSVIFTSQSPLNWEDLRNMVYFKAKSNGDKPLLVNNQKSLNIILREGDVNDETEPSRLIISEKGYAFKRFYNVHLSNPLPYNVVVRWKIVKSKDLVFSDDSRSFKTFAGENKKVLLTLWLTGQQFLSSPADVIQWTAISHSQTILLNGQTQWMVNSNDLQLKTTDDAAKVLLSSPEEFFYTVHLAIFNNLKTSIRLKWNLIAPSLKLSISSSDTSPIPPGGQNKEVIFTFRYSAPLKQERLRNIFKLYATTADSDKSVTVNGNSFILATPVVGTQSKNIVVRIAEKENIFPLALKVSNKLAKDIIMSISLSKLTRHSLMSQESYQVPSKSSREIVLYVNGPKAIRDFGILWNARTVDDEKVFMNGKEHFNMDRIPSESTEISITTPGSLYYVQFAIANPLSDIIYLTWSINDPELNIQQTSREKYIQPYQKRVITIRYHSSDQTQPRILRLIRLTGKNEVTKEQLLLNGESFVDVDGTKKQETSSSILLSSYRVEEKGFEYVIKLNLRNIQQPATLRWIFLAIDDSIESESPRQFDIIPNSLNKELRVTLKSKLPRNDKELNNLIAFTATDTNSKQSLLLNGKPFFVPEATLVGKTKRDPEAQPKAQDINFELPKEYYYQLRRIINPGIENDAKFTWEYTEFYLRNFFKVVPVTTPSSYIISPGKKIKLWITFVSKNPISPQILKNAIKVSATGISDQQRYLVNGKQSLVVGLESSINDKPGIEKSQEIVIAKSEKKYSININAENLLEEPVQLSWKIVAVSPDFKLYSSDDPITLAPKQNKKVSIEFGGTSEPTLQTKNLIRLYATKKGGSSPLLVNNKSFILPKFSRGNEFLDVKVSSIKENIYKTKLNIKNTFNADINIRWELNRKKLRSGGSLAFSENVLKLQPTKSLEHVVSVKLPDNIDEQILRDAISFTAYQGAWKNPVYINGKERFVTDLQRDDILHSAPVQFISITNQGHEYGVRFAVENTLDQVIKIHWKTRKLDQNYFTNTPKMFHIQPKTKMVVLVSLRFMKLLSTDQLQSLVFLSGYLLAGKNLVLLNEEEELLANVIPLEESKALPTPIQVRCSAPKTNRYVSTLTFFNPMKSPVLITWRFRQNVPVFSTSPKKIALAPSHNVIEKIKFETTVPLDEYSLTNLLQLTAEDQENGKAILLNGKNVFQGNFYSAGDSQRVTKIMVANKVFPYYAYIAVSNQYNYDVNTTWSLLSDDQSLFVNAPSGYLVRRGQQRFIRIPVFSLKETQPDQRIGVIGISAAKASGQPLLVNGKSMFPVNLIPGDDTDVKPILLQVFPQGVYAPITFNIFNPLQNEDIILYPKLMPGKDNSPEESTNDKSLVPPLETAISKEIRISSGKIAAIPIHLKKQECLVFTGKSSSGNSIMVNDGEKFTIGCGNQNFPDMMNVVVTNKGSKFSILTFIVDNKWNKDIVVKHTINDKSAEKPIVKVFSVGKHDKVSFFYSSPVTTGFSKIEIIESETNLLLNLPDGSDSLSIAHYPYRQDFYLAIHSAKTITITRPSFINLDIISLIDQDAILTVKNMSGRILEVIDVSKNQRELNTALILSYDSYPIKHIITGKTSDGQILYINGVNGYEVTPTKIEASIPVYISAKDDADLAPTIYYLDLTIKNRWKNTVMVASLFEGKIANMTLQPGETRQQVFIHSADTKPKARFLKFIDKDVGNVMLINGKIHGISLEYTPYSTPIVIDIQSHGEAQSFRSYFTVIKFVNKLSRTGVVKMNDKIHYLQPQTESFYIFRMLLPNSKEPKVIKMTATNKFLTPVKINKQNVFEVKPDVKQNIIVCSITLPSEEKFKNTAFGFINLLEKPAEVSFNDQDFLIIPGKMSKEIDLSFVSGSTIKTSAKTVQSGERLFLNGSSAVELFSSNLKKLVFVIHSKDTKFVRSFTTYFYYIIFKNRNPEPVTIRWEDKTKKDEVITPGNALMFSDIYYSKDRKSIRFSVYDKNNNLISLNGQTKFTYQPSYYGALQWNEFVINPDSSTKLSFINMAFVNMLPYTVHIRSVPNQMSWKLEPRSYTEIQWKRISGDKQIEFGVTNSNDDKEYINGFYGTYYLNINDKEDAKRKMFYIGQKSSNAAWADLGVLRIRVNFHNTLPNPVRIDTTIEDAKTSKIINPGAKFTFKTIIVRKTIRESVIDKNVQFKFFDLETGEQLKPYSKLTLPLELISENVYQATTDITFSSKTKRFVSTKQIKLDIINSDARPITINFSSNSKKPIPIKVAANSESTFDFTNEMMGDYESLSITSNEVADVNGQGKVFTVPFATNVYAMVVPNRKDYGKLYSIKLLNMFEESITVHWLLAGVNKYMTIPGDTEQVFYFYLDKNTKVIGLSAIKTGAGKPIFLNGNKIYDIDLTKTSSQTIPIKDPNLPKTRLSLVEFQNTQEAPVLIKFNVPSDKSIQMDPIIVDSKSTKRAYLTYPDLANHLILKAYKGDEMMNINGKFSKVLRPSINGRFTFFKIEDPASSKKSPPAEIDIRNNLKEPVFVSWVVNQEKEVLEVQPNDRVFAVISNNNRPFKMFASTKSGKTVYINGKEKFDFVPQTIGNIRSFIQLDSDQSDLEPKFIFLAIQNKMPSEIKLFWEWRGIGYITSVPTNRRQYLHLHVTGKYLKNDFQFVAKSGVDSSVKVFLNGKEKLGIIPYQNSNYQLVFADRDASRYSKMVSFRYINNLPIPVNVIWDASGDKRVVYAMPQSVVSISEPVPSDNDQLLVTAYEAGTTNPVFLNGKREVELEPSNDENILKGSSESNVYYYKILVNDYSGKDNDKKLIWKVGQKKTVFTIPYGAYDQPIMMRYTSASGAPNEIEVEAFSSSEQQLYLNNRLIFKPLPTNGNKNANQIVNIGKTISKSIYYFRLLVCNLHYQTATLKWNLKTIKGVEVHTRKIPRYYFNYVVFGNVEAFEEPESVGLTSFVINSDKKLYTNDQKSHFVQPVLQKRPKFNFIFISNYITAKNVTMHFNNPTSKDMIITWKTRGFRSTAKVPYNTENYNVQVTISGGFRNQIVVISAKTKDTNEPVQINGNRFARTRVPYRKPLVIDFPYKVLIFNNTVAANVIVKGAPGGITKEIPANSDLTVRLSVKQIPDIGITFKAVKKVDSKNTTINGEDSVTVKNDAKIEKFEIGSKDVSNRQYFVKLWITNNHTNNIALRWTERTWQNVIEIKPSFNGEVVLSFSSDEPIEITGMDVNTNNFVYLNRREKLRIVPSVVAIYAENVIISSEIALYDYFYRLIINNERNTNIFIALKSPKETTKAEVPPLNFKYSINTPLFNVQLGPKQPIQIFAMMKDGTPLYVNQKENIEVLPTLNDDEATIINVGKEIPRRIYYYSMKVSSPVGRDVIFRYTLPDGFSRMTRVPAPATNGNGFYSIVIPYKSLVRPTPVVFYAYNEKSNEPMLINGARSFTVLPTKDQGKQHVVYVSDKEESKSPASGQQFKFKYKVVLSNPTKKNAVMFWAENNISHKLTLLPNSKKTVEFATSQYSDVPVSVEFSAKSSGKPLKLNQKTIYYLKPLSGNSEAPVITVGQANTLVLTVNNKLNADIEISQRVGDIIEKFPIKSSTVGLQMKLTNFDIDKVNIFKAVTTSKQRPLYVNKQLELSIINPKDLETNVNGDSLLTLDISSKTYYYNLQVQNRELYPVTMIWNLRNRRQLKTIRGNSKENIGIAINDAGSKRPGQILFRCYRPYRHQQTPMYINNKYTISIQPAFDQNRIVNAVISSKLLASQIKYIHLDVINHPTEDVLLLWSQGKDYSNDGFDEGDKKLVIVGRRQNIHLAFPYQNNQLVGLTAVTASKKEQLIINNRREIFVQPSADKNAIYTVVVDRKENSNTNTYYLNLELQNNNENPIRVKYIQAGLREKRYFTVPARYHRWFYLAFDRVEGYPMSVHFTVYDGVTKRMVSLNDQPMYLFQSSSRFNTKSLVIGETIPASIYRNRKLTENNAGYPYFLGLYIWNQGNKDVRLYWNEPGTANKRYFSVPANSKKEFVYFIRHWLPVAPWVRIRAEKIVTDGISYQPLIDGYKGSDVIRLTRNKQLHFRFIGHQKRRHFKHFRYGIRFQNMASYNVLFKWNEGSKERKQSVKPLSNTVYYGIWSIDKKEIAKYKQPIIIIEAFHPSTNERILLNGEESVKFRLSHRETKLKSIYIEPDSAALRLRTYFIGFDVTNLLKDPVILRWIENSEKKSLSLQPHGSRSYDSSFVSSSQPSNIVAKAYNENSKKSIMIFGQQSYAMAPHQHHGRYVLLIGDLESKVKQIASSPKPVKYSIKMKIKNKAKEHLTLKWMSEGKEKTHDVPPGVTIRYAVEQKSAIKPKPIEFKVYKKGSTDQGRINGRQIMSIQPVEKPLVTLWKLTYGDIQAGELQTGFKYCNNVLDIAVLLDASGTMATAYPHAKEFIKLFADYFNLASNATHIGVITFSDKAKIHIPFNQNQQHSEFKEAIDRLPFDGFRTYIHDAYDEAEELLFNNKYGGRENAKKIMLLITDGRHNAQDVTKNDLKEAIKSKKRLSRYNVKITAVGLYGSIDPDNELLESLTGSKDRVHIISKYEQLYSQDFLDVLIDDECN